MLLVELGVTMELEELVVLEKLEVVKYLEELVVGWMGVVQGTTRNPVSSSRLSQLPDSRSDPYG